MKRNNNKISLNEPQLRNIIKESVKRIIREIHDYTRATDRDFAFHDDDSWKEGGYRTGKEEYDPLNEPDSNINVRDHKMIVSPQDSENDGEGYNVRQYMRSNLRTLPHSVINKLRGAEHSRLIGKPKYDKINSIIDGTDMADKRLLHRLGSWNRILMDMDKDKEDDED